MYKAMIIDDELIVREGIKTLLSWQEEGFALCPDGVDGRDGLKKILEYHPDVVLIDIKMPGLSGLEVAKEARDQGFKGEFIILTGYSEFEFAKSAISLGVREYLLKPVNENKLLECLRGIYGELEKKKQKQRYYSESEEKARKEILSRILLNGGKKADLEKEIRLFKMDFSSSTYCVAILSNREVVTERDKELYHEKVALFSDGPQVLENVFLDGRVILVLQNHSYEELKEVLRRKNERAVRACGKGLFISIGHNVSQWYDLNFSYECACYLLEYEFLYRERGIITIDEIHNREEEEGILSTERLCDYIEIGNQDAIATETNRFKKHCRAGLMKESEIKIQITLAVITLHHMLEKRYEETLAGNKEYQKTIEEVKKADNLEFLLNRFQLYLQSMCGLMSKSDSETVVRRMYTYMENNYYKDLKLETIAGIFNYSSAYLGKIFRNEMGDRFNNVLDKIRIENAKRLLSETDLKVYQVAKRVGYGNVDYFYMKFRKYVGMSPKEYQGDKK